MITRQTLDLLKLMFYRFVVRHEADFAVIKSCTAKRKQNSAVTERTS